MGKLDDFLILESASIRDALSMLCANRKQALFVVEGKVLKGALVDGDIRRFLLKGGDISALVKDAMTSHPKFLFTSERGKAQSFLQENNISAVPIVDDNMQIIDVVSLNEDVDIVNVKIRSLCRNDIKMVMEFFDQMAGDTRAMFNRNDVNRIRVMEHLSRMNDDHQVHFAATVMDSGCNEKMVGYVFLWDLDRRVPWLGIAVREDWKGHHLGRLLLKHIDNYLEPKGYGGVMLTSVPANIRAHSLYARMGFEYFGVYPDSEFLYVKRYEI